MARVLFIGGTGNISLSCVEQAVAAGHDVDVFNRGARSVALPPGVRVVAGDMRDRSGYRAVATEKFDVVCQFIAFTPAHMQADIDAFAGNTGQYIFISSASVYQKPPLSFVTTERTPAVNPFWDYSQDKIACEMLLRGARDLPWTIIRPSHTVRRGLPAVINEGDLVAWRMLEGKPVFVAGDGNTPWTLTRSQDFAVPFVRLFGLDAALGETFTITSDNAYSWDDIYRAIANGIGVETTLVHVPTDTLIRFAPEWEGPLVGDKSWTALFDNAKIKKIVGEFACEPDLGRVLAEPIAHFNTARAEREPPPDLAEYDRIVDRIVTAQSSLGH